jgi:single-strand DNA-binding protein
MAGSLNKATIIGNLGKDPETRSMQSGDIVCNFSIATSESWKDKSTGEKKERTEWHRIVVWNQGLAKVARDYLKKGSKVYIEGQIETREYEDKTSGETKYITEIVLRPFGGALVMLSSKDSGGSSSGYSDKARNTSSAQSHQEQAAPAPVDDFEDEIPF